MSDNSSAARDLLRTTSRGAGTSETAAFSEAAEQRPFANGRVGDRPQVTLCFRKTDYVRGFSYLHFCGIESENPAKGFTIEFPQARVTISGHNLEPLFRLVCQHRVAEIREVDRAQLFAVGDQEPIVERIDFKSLRCIEIGSTTK